MRLCSRARRENTHLRKRAQLRHSEKGYVNLLLSQKSKDKRHGDDTAMITARRDFLDLGYYLPLCEATTDAVLACAKDGDTLLDLGCGECYYTAAVMHEAEKEEYFFMRSA